MQIRTFYFWMIACFLGILALVGCGGGGGGTASVSGGTATIQGSVPGTVFIAVDDDRNMEVERVTAAGTPKTFSMNLPTEKNYRFYVMENEGTGHARIYPMYMGGNNVFALGGSANGHVISLGTVSPDPATGKSSPESNPPLMMGVGASAMLPPTLAGAAFSMDDVKGTSWAYNTMMTSGTMGWEHGTLTFDNNGLGRMTGIVRNGNPLSARDGIPYGMSLSGMLIDSADNTFRCVVSKDMSVMVATFTDNNGGPAMMIAQKRGGAYATDGSDMTGTWRFQRLTAGGDNTTSGWAYGSMQFVLGSASITSMTTNNGPGGAGTFAFSMDGNGFMTEMGNASFHGVMSADKTMIVATDTAGSYPELWIMMKDTGIPYAPGDMTGDWVMHAVSSGNPGSRNWAYGFSVVDAGGNDAFSGMMGSAGPIVSTQLTFTMNGGVMTMESAGGGMMGGGMTGGGMMGGGLVSATFHGIMNEAKDIMVAGYSDGNGGFPLTVQVK